MVKAQIIYDANVLREVTGNWQVEANNVVKEHIHYANGTNNWCTEDQDIFDKELNVNNPDYQGFAQEVKEKGFAGLTNIEIGTLWVIKRGITEEMVNIGPADSFGKTPTNSSNQMFIEAEIKRARGARRKQLKTGEAKHNKRGPKYNYYRPAYDKYVAQLLPWLRTLPSIKDDKSALTLIGLILYLGGHYELKGQYLETPPTVKKIVKEETGKRTITTRNVYAPISFTDYLWNRMKRVYYDFLKIPA